MTYFLETLSFYKSQQQIPNLVTLYKIYNNKNKTKSNNNKKSAGIITDFMENKMWKILLINVPSAADYLGLFRAFRLVCCIIRFLGQSHIWSRTCHRRLNFKCQGKCQIELIFHAEFRGGGATELLTEHFKHFFLIDEIFPDFWMVQYYIYFYF